MLGQSNEAYDGVVVVEAGDHPLAFLQGNHSVVVQLTHGLTSPHVVCLQATVTDAGQSGATFEFTLRSPLTERWSRQPMLRGHAATPVGDDAMIVVRAHDDYERRFDLFAGHAKGELKRVGSLRLGQRVVIEGVTRAERREPRSLLAPQAAA